MKKLPLVAGIVLLVVSVACIVSAVVSVINKTYTMGSAELWASVAFHAVTAVAGSLLLARARPSRAQQGPLSEADSPPGRGESSEEVAS